MIKITAKQDGFRRAGMAHTKEPKVYSDDKFGAAQIAALKNEPMLIVEEIVDDLTLLTVAQLVERLAKYQPTDVLKGVKKAELIEMLKAHQEVQ
jgi:hypothetical protein